MHIQDFELLVLLTQRVICDTDNMILLHSNMRYRGYVQFLMKHKHLCKNYFRFSIYKTASLLFNQHTHTHIHTHIIRKG